LFPCEKFQYSFPVYRGWLSSAQFPIPDAAPIHSQEFGKVSLDYPERLADEPEALAKWRRRIIRSITQEFNDGGNEPYFGVGVLPFPVVDG
jgi:hypothetical protein